MASTVPIQDLNLFPEPPPQTNTTIATSSSTTTPNMQLLTPKLEQKQEPFDEPPQLTLTTQNLLFSLSDPTPGHLHNPETTPSPSSDDQNSPYSEYFRISELFRNAFTEKLQKYGDVEALDLDSRAIVPVPVPEELQPEATPANASNNSDQPLSVVVSRRKLLGRSNELVWVTNLAIEDEAFSRDVVRRTRLMYNSICILAIMEEEKQTPGCGQRARGDLRAAALMRDRGLWLNRDKRIVGAIPGIEIGDLFIFRMELCVVGLKLHMRAANKVLETMAKSLNNAKQIGHISGIKVGDEFYWRGELSIVGLHYDFQRGIDCMKSLHGKVIATSIVDSGRYENVVEIGSDKLVYCGEGQNADLNCGKKPKDQKLSRGNLALKNNMVDKLPVRLIRRVVSDNCNYSFVYDGLCRVTDYRKEKGKFGTDVYKFSLRKYEERASV